MKTQKRSRIVMIGEQMIIPIDGGNIKMKNKLNRTLIILLAIFLIFTFLEVFAQDTYKKSFEPELEIFDVEDKDLREWKEIKRTQGIDTRIGAYMLGPFPIIYRNSRIAYSISSSFSARLTYQVYNGIGIQGEFNNYRIGFQAVYDLEIPNIELIIKPYLGFGINSSDIALGSLSLDVGSEINYSLLSWFGFGVGAEMLVFSDSYILEYYGGPSFSIFEWLTIDLLYTGLLSSTSHRIGGAGKISFKF